MKVLGTVLELPLELARGLQQARHDSNIFGLNVKYRPTLIEVVEEQPHSLFAACPQIFAYRVIQLASQSENPHSESIPTNELDDSRMFRTFV